MDEPVMEAAEREQVREVAAAAARPELDVMRGAQGAHRISRIEADPQHSLSNFPGTWISIVVVNKDGARVLVVDDEPNITELVAMALRYEGFTVKTAATGRGALTAVSQFSPSLVILDVMLPDIDGMEVLKRLNSAGTKVPIIFLTAKDGTEDKVHGLTIGGDDYVTKPFSIEELMARVRVVLRRHGNNSETGKLALADLELDDEAHEVRRHGHVVELTNTEYRLLRYLLINAGRVLTRSQILDHVWHYDFGGDASVLETYISYLRRKVDRYDPPLIQTVRGVGYVLRTPRK
jgi:two-component system OmpR family response regulator